MDGLNLDPRYLCIKSEGVKLKSILSDEGAFTVAGKYLEFSMTMIKYAC